MVTRIKSWKEKVVDFWDGIANVFPYMTPPIRPTKEETDFLIDSIQKVEKGDMVVLGATIENVRAGVKNGFEVYVPDFSQNMRNYLINACNESIRKKYHRNIHIINYEWSEFVNKWEENIEKGNLMKYYSMLNTLRKHSGKKCKVVAGDGSLAFIEGPNKCYELIEGIRNIIDEDGAFVIRVGVHEPDRYKDLSFTIQELVIKTKEKEKEKNPDKLEIEKERLNREFCYSTYRPSDFVDYVKFNGDIDQLVGLGHIVKENGELVKKPLAKLGNFRPYVPLREEIEVMFKEAGFEVKKGPIDIVNCHMLSYCLTPV